MILNRYVPFTNITNGPRNYGLTIIMTCQTLLLPPTQRLTIIRIRAKQMMSVRPMSIQLDKQIQRFHIKIANKRITNIMFILMHHGICSESFHQ